MEPIVSVLIAERARFAFPFFGGDVLVNLFVGDVVHFKLGFGDSRFENPGLQDAQAADNRMFFSSKGLEHPFGVLGVFRLAENFVSNNLAAVDFVLKPQRNDRDSVAPNDCGRALRVFSSFGGVNVENFRLSHSHGVLKRRFVFASRRFDFFVRVNDFKFIPGGGKHFLSPRGTTCQNKRLWHN